MFSNPTKILGFDDRILVLFGIVLNTHTVMGIYYTGAFFEVDFISYTTRWIGELTATVILWVVIRELYLVLLKNKPGIENQKRRLLLIPTLLIPYFLIAFLHITYVDPVFSWNYEQYGEPSMPVQIMTGTVLFFVDVGFYEALHLFVELKDSKLRQEQLEKERVTTQLMNLKNQISPHFLFNCLNTLMYLIDENQEKSKEFVYKLSYIYKAILKAQDKELVSLKEEMAYINAYTDLLGQRFGKNLNFNFEIDYEGEQKKIVPLALQIGIENAVKHNIISKKMPLTVDVRIHNNYLVIKNNLQKRPNEDYNSGFGLSSISKRYSLLTNKKIEIDDGGNDFILKLPLINL